MENKIKFENRIGLFSIIHSFDFSSDQVKVIVNPNCVMQINQSVAEEMIRLVATKYNYITTATYFLFSEKKNKTIKDLKNEILNDEDSIIYFENI